ncbi:hypothetical protein CC80DRAFT_179552 [Byssothecium circinans]|uniref:Uncharacterized protein n=1 Tax=Byssothecium circinans TaxID=147558 RepID=A0A6A5THN3_9PLEO|nr:hypothetical protein CC80DRAFT_179552 [Byssothecium circinans]
MTLYTHRHRMKPSMHSAEVTPSPSSNGGILHQEIQRLFPAIAAASVQSIPQKSKITCPITILLGRIEAFSNVGKALPESAVGEAISGEDFRTFWYTSDTHLRGSGHVRRKVGTKEELADVCLVWRLDAETTKELPLPDITVIFSLYVSRWKDTLPRSLGYGFGDFPGGGEKAGSEENQRFGRAREAVAGRVT